MPLLHRLERLLMHRIVCSAVGCNPDWPAMEMLGLSHPRCKQCGKEIP